MKTAEVRAVFEELKQELVPLIAEVGSVERRRRLHGRPVAGGRAARVLAQDHRAVRLRPAVRAARPDGASVRRQLRHAGHPADHALRRRTTSTRSSPRCTSAATACTSTASRRRSSARSLCHGASYALHESQSRLWENLVGRSREFWNHFYPSFQATFPEAVGDVDQERFYRAINRVKPSFIRVDADEATYNLHIILRFELEQEILAGTIELQGPARGLERPLRGVLRPRRSRTTGSACCRTCTGRAAASATSRPTRSATSCRCRSGRRCSPRSPTCPSSSSRASSAQLHEWLRSRLYSLGRKFTPQETLERVVGGPIDAGPYIRYLKEKLGTLAAA